jgi:hypothetical protein
MGAMEKNAVTHQRVERATTNAEVIMAISDFMGALSRQDIDRLPRFNRPGSIEDAEAVHRWAAQLSRYQPSANQDPLNDTLFASVRQCFARASNRLMEISRAV